MKKKLQVLKYESLIKIYNSFKKLRGRLEVNFSKNYNKISRIDRSMKIISKLISVATGLPYFEIEWLYYIRLSKTKSAQRRMKKLMAKNSQNECSKKKLKPYDK